MNILLVMIPLSILFLIGAGIAFFWAVDHDQFDDLDTPRLLPLLDRPGEDGSAPAGPGEPAGDPPRAGAEAAGDDNPADGGAAP